MVSSRCEVAFRSSGREGSGGNWFSHSGVLSVCALQKSLLTLVLPISLVSTYLLHQVKYMS